MTDITGGRGLLRERLPYVLLAQAPLLGVLAVLTTILWLSDPDSLFHPGFVTGVLLAILASGVAFVGIRVEILGRWMALIPLADMVVVGLVRSATYAGVGVIPALGSLLLFPVLWLTIVLEGWAIPVVIAGGVFVAGYPVVGSGQIPDAPIEWLNLGLIPLTFASISLGTLWVVRRMGEGRRRADELAARLQVSLAEVADREATLSSVTETVDAAILVLDADGEVILSNETARQFYERASVADDGSYQPEQLIFAEDRTTPIPARQNIQNRALRGDPLAGRVYWVGAPGNQRALSAASRRVVRSDGRVLGTVVVSHDVTRLMESIEVRDAFLATVSHELNTPLTNIIGYLELLESDTNGAEVAIIRNNADRLQSLVGDLLDSGASARVIRMPGDVSAVAAESLAGISARAVTGGIRLRQTGLASLSADVDYAGIRRVMDVLLSNALAYSGSGSSIVVDVATEGGQAILTVADRGIGIDPAHLGRVFEKFYRAPHARSQAIRGTGLGLSIAKAIVDAHDGALEVTSTPGVGSTFTVLLPLRSASAQ